MTPIRLTIWNEYRREKQDAAVAAIYPDGIHAALAQGLAAPGLDIRTATLDAPEHGLTDDLLASTDVLFWWGHLAHDAVADAVVDRVLARIHDGMGLVALHSSLESKIFRRLMGTTCTATWRIAEGGERQRLWVIDPGHPIAEGIGAYIELPAHEMYGEPFDILDPDALVFISWFQGGEVFRSGCCFRRGRGRVFYFAPGHETFPVYWNADILRVLRNAARWAAPAHATGALPRTKHRPTPLEPGAPAQKG